jgi:ADP-dependent NAD(P)H-hydrate dehydratase / NAD(P)H-hydrate epimerase
MDKGAFAAWSDEDSEQGALRELVQRADVIVDALLGTGVARPIEGVLARILSVVRDEIEARSAEPNVVCAPASPASPRQRPQVVAVDVPSGIDCDTGAVDPSTLAADVTITFACPKVGHLLATAPAFVGKLVVADIGISSQHLPQVTLSLSTSDEVAKRLPVRPAAAHKGTFGKALVVAGSANYVGAAYLASSAAARVGVGLVALAAASSLHPIFATKCTEAIHLLLPDDRGGLVLSAAKLLSEHWSDYDALLLGPGLGRAPKTAEFVMALLCGGGEPVSARLGFVQESVGSPDAVGCPKKLVLDADALNILSEVGEWWHLLPDSSVLTPHPGEMARLTGSTVEAVQAKRLDVARDAARAWGHVVVLKGAHTVVATPYGEVTISPFANPGLASAGTGDVLAGAIVGLLAQGVEPYHAAVAGVYVHGLAGELARADLGEAGMLASDLLPLLPRAIKAIRGQ